MRAGPVLRGRAAGGSRVGRTELVRARGPISPWGHSGPPRAGDSAGAAVAAGAMCACVRLAAHGGLAAASRCAWPPCGGRAISAVVWRRCGSPFLSVKPALAPAGASRVRRAALASSDRAWVIWGRLCRSCHWISNPIGRRAPLPDHQRPPHGSLIMTVVVCVVSSTSGTTS